MDEIYPFVSNMKKFKSCCLIVDYICIMAGGMIFTLFQGTFLYCFSVF
ncbi:hypothetical protein T01_2801 [Trichinella spiralis]|uniref:Uncharacterized protein n=1 Tax=Trichinella spiralis TaxID=6334 RepID=A0A0V0YTE9_TRISP|nr:hypothetical protein T01_2801 [Trichinella spiralis]